MKRTILLFCLLLFPISGITEGNFSVPHYDSSLLLEVSINRLARKLYRELTEVLKPVKGKISSGFGKRVHPLFGIVKHHHGIDIACAEGSEVRAVLPGRVAKATWKGGYGKFIELSHAGELDRSRYAHLSKIIVRNGQLIKKGALIGFSGQTGRVTGPHLHFELSQEGRAIDPQKFLEKNVKIR